MRRGAEAFLEARASLEEKQRSFGEKEMDIASAAAFVKDGDHVAIGGCLYSRTPTALLNQLLRDRRRDLTLSRSLMCYEGELFLVQGAAKEIMTSWMGMGFRWGISKILRSFIESGRAKYDEWSHLSLGLRYKAAAMGMPFLPTASMLRSDLIEHNGAVEMACPFTGETLCLVPAHFPNVALIHVHRADRFGNAQIVGYEHMDADIARASSTVIVTAEEVVSTEEIAAHPDSTILPHFLVDAVVEVPMGSYPHECYGLYDVDFPHLDSYASRVVQDGEKGVEDYLSEAVLGTTDHAEFVERFSFETMVELKRKAKEMALG